MEIRVKLFEILKERNITQSKLSEMTGIRQAAISDIANNRRDTINKKHLCAIAEALEIEDIAELVTFK